MEASSHVHIKSEESDTECLDTEEEEAEGKKNTCPVCCEWIERKVNVFTPKCCRDISQYFIHRECLENTWSGCEPEDIKCPMCDDTVTFKKCVKSFIKTSPVKEINIGIKHQELDLIMKLIKKYPIIENRQTNTRNILERNHAWYKISKSYNSHPRVAKRSVTQLMKVWESIKMQSGDSFFNNDASKSSRDTENKTLTESQKSESSAEGKYTSTRDSQSNNPKSKPFLRYMEHVQELCDIKVDHKKVLLLRHKELLEYQDKKHELELQNLKLQIQFLKEKSKLDMLKKKLKKSEYEAEDAEYTEDAAEEHTDIVMATMSSDSDDDSESSTKKNRISEPQPTTSTDF